MNDPELAAALRSRSPDALPELLDAYGDQLFSYCWRLLRNRENAQIAVRDALVVATAQIERLFCDEWLGLWLYSLARAECLRREAVPASDADEPAALPNTDDADSRLMAWNAVTSMPADEVEALELDSRHDVDLRLVLGLSAAEVQALLDRARRDLERTLGAEILVRKSHACPDRAALLDRYHHPRRARPDARARRHLLGLQPEPPPQRLPGPGLRSPPYARPLVRGPAGGTRVLRRLRQGGLPRVHGEPRGRAHRILVPEHASRIPARLATRGGRNPPRGGSRGRRTCRPPSASCVPDRRRGRGLGSRRRRVRPGRLPRDAARDLGRQPAVGGGRGAGLRDRSARRRRRRRPPGQGQAVVRCTVLNRTPPAISRHQDRIAGRGRRLTAGVLVAVAARPGWQPGVLLIGLRVGLEH